MPKILISCHPQNASLIPAVTEDALEEANCAVYCLRENFAESGAAEKESSETGTAGKVLVEPGEGDKESDETEVAGRKHLGVKAVMEYLEFQLAEMNLFVLLVTPSLLEEGNYCGFMSIRRQKTGRFPCFRFRWHEWIVVRCSSSIKISRSGRCGGWKGFRCVGRSAGRDFYSLLDFQ